ncbi:MAG: gliding motility-associated C-terminal domain-containing protein [Flavobacteriales bacterium]|nr:gliding motility-associated C-terminal domain-containing protein [Flavobacteriales bacterium]
MRYLFLNLIFIAVFSSRVCAVDAEPREDRAYLFTENLGQWNHEVLFRTEIPGGYLFVTQFGLSYSLHDSREQHEVLNYFHHYRNESMDTAFTVHSHAMHVQFEGGSINRELAEGRSPENYYSNFFIGKDQKKWARGVRTYREVYLRSVYPSIDFHLYTGEDGSLKYDWIVQPGGDPDAIRMYFDGAESISVEHGYLSVRTTLGRLYESPPVILSSAPFLTPVTGSFEVDGNLVYYRIEGANDFRNHQLIIDPKLIFSTYSGSKGDNFGFTATYDSRGNLYAGGITDGYFGQYPVTTGAYQTTFGGGIRQSPANLACDISISKYDSAGTTLLYATYLGGAQDEYPHSLVVDNTDQLIVMGSTYSKDFPVTKTAFDTTQNGNTDIIVSKFSSDGTILLASTYIGGSGQDGLNSNDTLRYNYADDFRGDIFPDEDQNVYVASVTRSSNFPLKHPTDSVIRNYEGCVFELNPDFSELLWSTFIGGSGPDAMYSIKIDYDSNIVVGGGTASSGMYTSPGAIEPNYLGEVDGFVTVFDQGTKKIRSASYFGTSDYDQIYFVEINNRGNVFVAGQTTGNIQPSPGVYGAANKGQFVAKLDAGLRKIDFQTSFGLRNNQIDIAPTAFLVDNCEHIYMSGWGSIVRPDLNPGSTTDLEITSDAEQSTTDGNDFYIIVLGKDAHRLLYATYFGGSETGDHVDGGTSRFDKRGVIYQSVCASCPNEFEPGHQDFPITPGAAFTSNLSPRCSNASFKIDLQISTAVYADFTVNSVGCVPFATQFLNRSTIQDNFIWDFGDGKRDTVTLNPIHTYQDTGKFVARLIVIDSNSCNVSDTFQRTIHVGRRYTPLPEFDINTCSNEVQFHSKSPAPSYLWDFGDGDTSYARSPKHQYPEGGSFKIKFITNYDDPCRDSSLLQIQLLEPQKDLVIPNVFTPNGDNLNDRYCLEGLIPDCDSIEWRIYNRWGERLFYSTQLDTCWDGKTGSGKLLPSGTYFAIFKVFRNSVSLDYIHPITITLIRDED